LIQLDKIMTKNDIQNDEKIYITVIFFNITMINCYAKI